MHAVLLNMVVSPSDSDGPAPEHLATHNLLRSFRIDTVAEAHEAKLTRARFDKGLVFHQLSEFSKDLPERLSANSTVEVSDEQRGVLLSPSYANFAT